MQTRQAKELYGYFRWSWIHELETENFTKKNAIIESFLVYFYIRFIGIYKDY
jgi:hypothetical protein